MSVNSIADGATAFKLPTFNVTVPSKQTVKSAPPAVDLLAQTKVLTAFKPSPTAVAESGKKIVRGMSHVVESYNPQGKVRIKYMDSSNNIIYQIPSEMVAKTQDLMTNTQAATNVKG